MASQEVMRFDGSEPSRIQRGHAVRFADSRRDLRRKVLPLFCFLTSNVVIGQDRQEFLTLLGRIFVHRIKDGFSEIRTVLSVGSSLQKAPDQLCVMCPSCGANAVRPQVHHHHQAYLAFVNALKIIVQDKGGRFLLEFGAIARRE